MRSIRTTPAIVAILFLGLASDAAAQDPARAAIEDLNKRFVAAVSRGDAAAIGALYSSSAQAFPPNSPVVKGRAEIEKMWKGVFDSGIAAASLTTADVEVHGTVAFETGTYEMTLKDGKVADRGKYVVVWKRETGQWRLHRDIWNTNMPAAK
jgi:uncharacterized protein (TIGR02246 family)